MSQPDSFNPQIPLPPSGESNPSAGLPSFDPTPAPSALPETPFVPAPAVPLDQPSVGQPAPAVDPYATQPVPAADPYAEAAPAAPTDPYATQPAPVAPADPYATQPAPAVPADPYAQAAPVDPYAQAAPTDPYAAQAAPAAPADPYATQPAPADPYAAQAYPPAADPYAAQGFPPDQAQFAPGQPYAPDPGAYATQAPYAPAYPGQGYSGQLTPPPAKKKGKGGLIALIVILAVALIGGGGFAAWWFFIRVDPVTGPVTPGEARSPQAAVRGYLEALQAGRASDALLYAQTQPTNQTFLTGDVLSQSLAAGAISNIAVTKDAGSTKQAATVTATYNIGSQAVTASYDVTLSNKHWFLSAVTDQVDLSYDIMWDNIGLSLNGVSLDGVDLSTAEFFPGTYQVTLTNDMLTMTGNSQFVVTDPQGLPDPLDLTLDLSSSAQTSFQQAAKATLDGCMGEQDIMTSCGFGFTGLEGGGTPDLSTLTWTFESGSSSDFSGTTFTLSDMSDPTAADASIDIWIDVAIRDTNGDRYSDSVFLYWVDVDFSDPANPVVTFSS